MVMNSPTVAMNLVNVYMTILELDAVEVLIPVLLYKLLCLLIITCICHKIWNY